MTTTTTTRAAYVLVDGPFANINRDGDEYPQWTVSLMDDDDNDIKNYTCNSFNRAINLGESIARDRRIELVSEAHNA